MRTKSVYMYIAVETLGYIALVAPIVPRAERSRGEKKFKVSYIGEVEIHTIY